MTETNKALLGVIEAALTEKNYDVIKQVRAVIIRLARDRNVITELRRIETEKGTSATQSRGKEIIFKPEDFGGGKKKLRLEDNGVVATFNPTPEPTTKPTTEIKDNVTDEMETEMFKELSELNDNLLIQRFGGLKGLKSYGRDVLGLKIAGNAGKAKVIELVREELNKRTGTNEEEE